MRKYLFAFFLLISSPLFAQTYPVIHESRPRIMIDSARFAWLTANLSAGDCGVTYNQVVTAYTANWITDPQLYQVGSDTTIWTWDWADKWAMDQVLLTAVIYRLGHNPLQKTRCQYIIDHFIMLADSANFATMSWYPEETLLRTMSDAGDVLMDWLYDSIPVPKRQQFMRAIYKTNREFMNKYVLSSSGTAYVGSHNDLNCVMTMQNALTLFNGDGLTIPEKDTVLQWYDTLYNKWTLKFFPVYGYYRGNDGGWNWSGAYSMWSLVDQFKLFDNMLIGTGKNFYTDLPWVKNSINQYWYLMQPNNNCINWGDGGTNMTGDIVTYRHSVIFNDPRSNWLAQYFTQPAMLTWTMPIFWKLVYRDFNAPVVSKPSPPLDWQAVHAGLSESRTSWDSSAALVWFYNAYSKKNNHEHNDNNTFSIFKNAPLIIDAGDYDSYGSSHWYNYYTRTIAHNTLCVFDSTDHYFYYGTVPVSNDGGQHPSNTLISYSDIFASQNQKGIWLKWASGNNYCYNIAEAAMAYDTAKLDRYVRRVLFDKPDHVIVLDHIHLKNIATRQRDASFILHFTNEPSISGSLLTSDVPGHIEKFNGKDYLAQSGKGNVAVRTLLPELSNTTRIGGTGYEYWVNGLNYPPTGTLDTIYQTPGKWRIEVRPNSVTDSLLFLHTIKIGDSANVSVAGGVGQQNNFSIGIDWDNALYYFCKTGDTLCNYHIMDNIPGGRTVMVKAFDLYKNTLYDIVVNGVVNTTGTTDTNGTLIHPVILPSGNCKVEILRDRTIATTIETNNSKYKIYPNPAHNELTITYNGIITTVSVYNLSGQKVYDGNFNAGKVKISLGDLPDGFYLIKINNDEIRRFLIQHQ